MMKRILLVLIFTIATLSSSTGQSLPSGQKRWNSSNNLTFDDYKIKTSNNNVEVIFSQFQISHSVKGFDFLKKNLNQKIQNIFLGNASWIDTTHIKNIDRQIKFQQLQFDLAEVLVRKFRKRLLINKKKLAKGTDFVQEISNQIFTEFSEIRMKLIEETESGSNSEKVIEWEKKIAKQLIDLEVFSYENKKKIKLDKK